MSLAQGKGSVQRTYSFDGQTVDRFESLVPAGQRSRVIGELMSRRVEEIEAEKLRELIHAGLADMADVYEETGGEWVEVDAEGWRSA
ncbi:hypothetical protein BH11ARM2_BH11ARM2_17240 [soil metagenome]